MHTTSPTELCYDYILSYLTTHPCVECGESNILVLEFDHRRNKIDGVMSLARTGITITKLTKEIAKCDVRCANCHKLRHTIEDRTWLYRKLHGELVLHGGK